MDLPQLTDHEFGLFQKMIYQTAGIHMAPVKKALISGRLAKRLKHYGLASYGDYFRLLYEDESEELQVAVDLLTTNETFFFREPKHFEFLQEEVLPHWTTGPKRFWSAASSSGEEAYTLAMVLAEFAPQHSWEIIGTDLCSRVVEKARSGHYELERASHIPPVYLAKYCLKGVGNQEGTFLISPELQRRTQFFHANLKDDLNHLGSFDVIFLRNLLIYFDQETKKAVVSNLVRRLKSRGFLIVGHSETLNGISEEVQSLAPSIYQKP
ncbi:MAG: SAM-dependent methyltransferase [Candidatus Lambdaproteobacteria bacterium RIFOXYD1_FULL_56_27]|nr:MAG: SAM-dependent methyltransferase [Candidatus Lambdaproteobacteria bacterium RIFOXYC1_FULL_56_13]OGH06852.1 MAG: SAM-dependent methyltransferase [Candidatus Lambdaproteobacteria bacterium RIFOXYD1_FULL_56_27]